MMFEADLRKETVLEVAKKMMAAARTAPKAKGIDNLSIAICTDEEIKKISQKMIEMVDEEGHPEFFKRDAGNLLNSDALVLIGTSFTPIGVQKCGQCGLESCKDNTDNPNIPCAFNVGDLGIAVGSAVSIAADNRVDNRVMYSVGKAAEALGLFSNDVKIIHGIPLSVKGKSPFFDRK